MALQRPNIDQHNQGAQSVQVGVVHHLTVIHLHHYSHAPVNNMETVLAMSGAALQEEPPMDEFVKEHMLKVAAEYEAARARRQAKYGSGARRNS